MPRIKHHEKERPVSWPMPNPEELKSSDRIRILVLIGAILGSSTALYFKAEEFFNKRDITEVNTNKKPNTNFSNSHQNEEEVDSTLPKSGKVLVDSI